MRRHAWCSCKNEIVEGSKHDTDFDGRPNDSSIVVRRQIYEHGVLREELVDENKDGVFDYKIISDPFGTRSERIPIEPAK